MVLNSIHITSSGTVMYNTDTPIAGFQFDVDGAEINGASGGDAEAAGFMISSSTTTTLGFSLSGATIFSTYPKRTLVFLDYIEGSSAICISRLIVSDDEGNALDFQTGKCWVH